MFQKCHEKRFNCIGSFCKKISKRLKKLNLKENERKCLDIENTFLIRMYFVTFARGLGANAFGLVTNKT